MHLTNFSQNIFQNMQHPKIFKYVKMLALFGIILAMYLLVEQQMPKDSFKPCTINSTVNCDAIISGPVSKILGIPTPLYGLTGYLCILIAAIYKKPKIIAGVAAAGLVFCLWIGYREIFQLHVLCPVCILCQIDMIAVCILSIILNLKNQLTPTPRV